MKTINKLPLYKIVGRNKAFSITTQTYKGAKIKKTYYNNTNELFEAYEALKLNGERFIISINYGNEKLNEQLLFLILEIKKEHI